ncbi:MAG: hypothetical protein OEV72_14400, partial [Thermoleophilia bacterium]|nr:hypothetical protein [Thermoleophilia bacterium]
GTVGFGQGAGSFSGSNLSMRLAGAQKNVPLPANQIDVLSKIDVQKVVQGGTAQPGDFCFSIDPDPRPSGQGPVCGQGSFLALPTGTYTITESGPSVYTLQSVTGQNCTAVQPLSNRQASASVTAAPTPVTASCTFTNVAQPTRVKVVKSLSPADDPGTFTVSVAQGGQVLGSATGGDGTVSGFHEVAAGSPVTVGEVGAGGTSLASYATAITCDNGKGSGAAGATTYAFDVTAADSGTDITCTIANTRKTGSLELKKAWSGTAGDVTLRIGTSAGGADVASTPLSGVDGSTGALTVNTGTYYVSELLASPGDYTSALACTRNGDALTPGAGSSVTVGDGATVVCTYTNTRKTGSIELKKAWSGTAGDVTLRIGTSAGGSEVASTPLSGVGGSTGAKIVDTGTFYVSELLASPGDYTSALACTRNGNALTPGTDGSVAVGGGDTVVCTYTNTRKTGSVEVKKVWSGGAGEVTLGIGTTPAGTEVASKALSGVGGTTGAKTVDTGTYYVSEALSSPGDYLSSLACTRNGDAFTPGQGDSVEVAQGDVVVCTYTNTRRTGSVTVVKQYVGTPTTVELFVGTKKQSVSESGGQVSDTVPTGTQVAVGETTVPAGWDAVMQCTGDEEASAYTGPRQVVATEAGITCTITNKQRPLLRVAKVTVGGDPGDAFDLKIDDQAFTNGGQGYVNGDTGFRSVTPGVPHTVSEVGHGSTDLAKYA